MTYKHIVGDLEDIEGEIQDAIDNLKELTDPIPNCNDTEAYKQFALSLLRTAASAVEEAKTWIKE